MADVFKLTAEEQASLRAQTEKIVAIRDAIGKLRLAGIDVTELQARLEQANAIKNGLLEHFGQPVTPR